MSILKISRLGHPILLKKTNPVQNIADKEIKKIIYDMSETMIDAKGIGLAAPQVYINKQIMIFRTFCSEAFPLLLVPKNVPPILIKLPSKCLVVNSRTSKGFFSNPKVPSLIPKTFH